MITDLSSNLIERLSSTIGNKVDCLSQFLCLQVAEGRLQAEQAEYTLRSLSTWLSGEGYNHEERMKILSMLFKEEVELLTDCFCAEVVFGTAGIRQQLRPGPNGVNIDMIRYYTQAAADVVNAAGQSDVGVVVGYDVRNDSDRFAEEETKIFAANGIKVYKFIVDRPIPVIAHFVRQRGAYLYAYNTASHNPPEYNGIKFGNNYGAQLFQEQRDAIVAQRRRVSLQNVKEISIDQAKKIKYVGSATDVQKGRADIDADSLYMDQVERLVLDPGMVRCHSPNIKIVYEPLYGTGRELVPQILRQYGFQVEIVKDHAKADGNFPDLKNLERPDPAEDVTLEWATELAEERRSDVIIATDPDADRMGFKFRLRDGTWKLFQANEAWSLLLWYRLKKRKELEESGKLEPVDWAKRYIVKSWVTIDLLRSIANERFGINGTEETPVGFKDIAERVLERGEENWEGGFEESNGMSVGGHTLEKDGALAAILMAEVYAYAKSQDKSFEELLDDIYLNHGYYATVNIPLEFSGLQAVADRDRVMNWAIKLGGEETIQIGGRKAIKAEIDKVEPNSVRFFFGEENHLTIRPSGTEPKIRFYGQFKREVNNQAELQEVKHSLFSELKQFVEDVIDEAQGVLT